MKPVYSLVNDTTQKNIVLGEPISWDLAGPMIRAMYTEWVFTCE